MVRSYERAPAAGFGVLAMLALPIIFLALPVIVWLSFTVLILGSMLMGVVSLGVLTVGAVRSVLVARPEPAVAPRPIAVPRLVAVTASSVEGSCPIGLCHSGQTFTAGPSSWPQDLPCMKLKRLVQARAAAMLQQGLTFDTLECKGRLFASQFTLALQPIAA